MSGYDDPANEDTTGDTLEDTEIGEHDPIQPQYATVQEWVEDFFARITVRRSSNDFRWCPRWWAHPEVVSRLTGLWTAWEQARVGTSVDMNTWWLQELDPHLAVITATNGPLYGCSQHEGHTGTRPGLVVETTPPGTFGSA